MRLLPLSENELSTAIQRYSLAAKQIQDAEGEDCLMTTSEASGILGVMARNVGKIPGLKAAVLPVSYNPNYGSLWRRADIEAVVLRRRLKREKEETNRRLIAEAANKARIDREARMQRTGIYPGATVRIREDSLYSGGRIAKIMNLTMDGFCRVKDDLGRVSDLPSDFLIAKGI
jgi:hypothetical protein